MWLLDGSMCRSDKKITSLNLQQTDACLGCFSANLLVRYLGRHVIWRPETSKVQWSVRRACQGMVTAMLLTKPSTISRGAPRDSKSSLTAWRKEGAVRKKQKTERNETTGSIPAGKKSHQQDQHILCFGTGLCCFFPSRDICPVTLDADIKCEAIMAKGGGMFVLKVFIHQGRDTVNRVSWWCVSHKCTSSKKPS